VTYFRKAKSDLGIYECNSNYGPGFVIRDETTMEVEREHFNEAFDSAALWVQRVEFAGSLNALVETHDVEFRFRSFNGMIVNF